MHQALKKWHDLFSLCRMSETDKQIVIYSEHKGFWPHFRPTVECLIGEYGHSIIYVTSDPDDPILHETAAGITPFYVGQGMCQIAFFKTLNARVVITSTPDIGSFHLEKSPKVKSFVYLHHSVVSTHMIYREAAFDSFDVILCVGPHHIQEIREREKLKTLPNKQLVEHGYGPIDELATDAECLSPPTPSVSPNILIAPSWGPHGLLETLADPLCRTLIESGYSITVRPHPRTDLLRPDIRQSLEADFGHHERFQMDQGISSRSSLLSADLMISDWSGSAFEYAFSRLRPVLFIDVPKKINNPNYEELSAIPIEISAREKIGQILSPDDMSGIGGIVDGLLVNANIWAEKIKSARQAYIFNLGKSGQAGAEAITKLLGK